MPTPTLIARQQGEAWKRPFIAVYEPFTGKENSQVLTVSVIDHSEPGNFTALKIVNKDGSSQLVFQALDGENHYSNNDWQFSGHFSVIGLRNEKIDYIYLGNGNEAGYQGYSLRINDSAGAASLQVRADRLKISCNQETLVTIPEGKIKKITLVNAGIEKNLVFLVDNATISFTVAALSGAEILLRQ
jgi:hypothetical protein